MRWNKVSLIGLGLLGGSIGMAVRARGLARRVSAAVRRGATLDLGIRMGAVDEGSCDLMEVVRGADLVVLCTPLAQMPALAEAMRPALAPHTLITDVGSSKAVVVEALDPLVAQAGAAFVGSHPMAGGEQTGVEAARADLFENAVCVVTPTPRTAPGTTEAIERFWADLGGRTLRLDPELHDRLASRASHLPHVVAAAIARHVLDPAHPAAQASLCANGFRDTTRVASGSPEMWRDIALANPQFIADAIAAVTADLERFTAALRAQDAAQLLEFFATARERRERWNQARRARSSATP